MNVSRRAFAIGGAALVAAGSNVCRASAAAALTTARVTFGPPGVNNCFPLVALEKGFAAAEGLDLKFVFVDGGVLARQVIASNNAEFSVGDISFPLQLINRQRGAKILAVSETMPSAGNIVVRKDLFDQGIKTPEALADWTRPGGAKPIIAATQIGSSTWSFGSYVFEKLGRGDRMNWVSGGNPDSLLGGLKSKQFDAIMAQFAWLRDAESQGFGQTIFDTSDEKSLDRIFGGRLPTGVAYALDSTIEAQPKMVQGFMNACYRSLQWLKQSSPDEIYALLGQKYLGSRDPDPVKREIAFFKSQWNYDGLVTEENFKRVAPVVFREGTGITTEIPYKDSFDLSFIQRAKQQFG